MKKKVIPIVLIVFLIAFGGLLYLIFRSFLIVFIYELISLIILIINYFIRRSIEIVRKSQRIDYMNDKRRDFDIMVIGMPIRIDETTRKILYLTHKKRNLLSSYLFLIHNFSYLKENDGLVIVNTIGMDCTGNYITIFDYKCFHPVINMRFGLNTRLLNYAPLLFYFKKFKTNSFIEEQKDLIAAMTSFCKDHNIKIKFIK